MSESDSSVPIEVKYVLGHAGPAWIDFRSPHYLTTLHPGLFLKWRTKRARARLIRWERQRTEAILIAGAERVWE